MTFGLSAFAQAVVSAVLLIAVLALYLYRFAASRRWLVVIGAVCLLDQYLKLTVLRGLHGQSFPMLFGTINIVYQQNHEQGFGSSFSYLLMATLVCVLALMFLYDRLTKTKYRMSGLAEFGFALMIGGCAGILLDRIMRGFVIDFLEFGPASTFVYNLADLAVIAAVMVLLLRGARYLLEPRDWHQDILEGVGR